jgi:hypothetical protein
MLWTRFEKLEQFSFNIFCNGLVVEFDSVITDAEKKIIWLM